MGMIETLLGRKARNSANLAREMAAQEAGIEASRAKIVEAQAARKAAIENFDDEGHKAADDAMAASRRDIERREVALEKLKVAHAGAIDAEAREAFRQEDAALARETEAVADRLQREYPAAAATIGALVVALETLRLKRAALILRGKELGESVTCGHAETFRGVSPKSWSARWPNPGPEGGVVQGPVADAPRGSIKWVEGEPVSTRDDVVVRFRGGGEAPLTLAFTIGDLPGLFVGEAPHHVQPRMEPEALVPRG